MTDLPLLPLRYRIQAVESDYGNGLFAELQTTLDEDGNWMKAEDVLALLKRGPAKDQDRLLGATFNQHMALALHMRANYIETGDVNTSVADLLSAKAFHSNGQVVKRFLGLTHEQEALVKQLRARAAELERD